MHLWHMFDKPSEDAFMALMDYSTLK
jgi:hypothetical protein